MGCSACAKKRAEFQAKIKKEKDKEQEKQRISTISQNIPKNINILSKDQFVLTQKEILKNRQVKT